MRICARALKIASDPSWGRSSRGCQVLCRPSGSKPSGRARRSQPTSPVPNVDIGINTSSVKLPMRGSRAPSLYRVSRRRYTPTNGLRTRIGGIDRIGTSLNSFSSDFSPTPPERGCSSSSRPIHLRLRRPHDGNGLPLGRLRTLKENVRSRDDIKEMIRVCMEYALDPFLVMG
jgi:hypothetical protein